MLIQSILNGNREAEKTLYEKYKKITHDFIKSKYFRSVDIEDDISEILIKVFYNLRLFDSKKSKFKSWVLNIIKNHMIDKWRSSNTTINVTDINNYFNASDTTDGVYYPTDEYSISDNPEFDFNNELLSITTLLSPLEFNMIKMRADGYRYNEIAQEFNMSSSTVSNKINYIKTKLKKEL